MPSSRPITNSGWGVGPLYSRTRATGASPVPGHRPAGRARTRVPRGRRWRTRRTAGRVRGSRAGAPCRSSPWRRRRHGGRPRSRPSVGTGPAPVSAAAAGTGSGGGSAGGRRGSRASPPSAPPRSPPPRAGPASNGARTTPSSVTMPVISSAGVTSNDGLRTSVPGGAMRTPRNSRTSSAGAPRSRWPSPSGVARSTDARRRADVERDAVARREHGQRCRCRPCWRCRRWPRPGPRRRG